MKYFLAKTDPDTYSIEQFAKDKSTIWDGVRNPQAVKALQSMRPGDRVFIYHSMGEGAIRGLAVVEKNLGIDPQDNKSWLVKLKLTRVFQPAFVTIKDIKSSGKFPNHSLVKQSRLSTMPIEHDLAKWIICQIKQN